MSEIKVTEMTEATQINDNDLLMIVQNEKSKKVKLSTIKNQEYSTGEQVIGTWIDGKPIYRKVVYIGSLPANTASFFSHNISNIDRVVNSSMTWFDTADNCWWSNRRWDSATIRISYNVNPTQIWIEAKGVNWSTRTNQAYVTIEYTKTTD